jgi:hypothetical protein
VKEAVVTTYYFPKETEENCVKLQVCLFSTRGSKPGPTEDEVQYIYSLFVSFFYFLSRFSSSYLSHADLRYEQTELFSFGPS